MTLYSYICPACRNKQEVARHMNDDELPVLCEKDGFVMRRDYKADFSNRQPCGNWPYYSYAAGVHPKQVPEMMKFDKEHGVSTEYLDGDPQMKSPGHRKKYCEAHGLFDRNAGLNDPVPARCR